MSGESARVRLRRSGSISRPVKAAESGLGSPVCETCETGCGGRSMFTRLLPRMSLTDDLLSGMGASEWSYVTPYRRDIEVSLRELQQRVFRDGGEVKWVLQNAPCGSSWGTARLGHQACSV